jgi:hypothetical protein
MFRRFFTLLSALSLVICIATCTLWVRSARICDTLWFNSSAGNSYALKTKRHGVVLFSTLHAREGMVNGNYAVFKTDFPEGWHLSSFQYHPPPKGFVAYTYEQKNEVEFAGFGWNRQQLPPTTATRLAIPFWFVAAISAMPCLARVVAWIRTGRRHVAGCCPACGYDLRVTPERCPECGMASKQGASEKSS